MNIPLRNFFRKKGAMDWIERKLDYACSAHGITLLQYYILYKVRRKPTASMDVQESIPWRDSAITVTLDQMEAAGLIIRKRIAGQDMRRKYVIITKEGKKVLRAAEKDLDEISVSLTKDVWYNRKKEVSPEMFEPVIPLPPESK